MADHSYGLDLQTETVETSRHEQEEQQLRLQEDLRAEEKQLQEMQQATAQMAERHRELEAQTAKAKQAQQVTVKQRVAQIERTTRELQLTRDMRQTELNRYQAEQDSLAEQERQLQQVQIRTDKMLQSLNKQADTDQAEIIKDTDKLVPQPASATTKPTTTSMDELVALLQQKVVSTLTAKFDLPTSTTEDESAEPPAKRLKTQASPTPNTHYKFCGYYYPCRHYSTASYYFHQ